MSEAIKRMLADRQAVADAVKGRSVALAEQDARDAAVMDQIFAEINAASLKIDHGAADEKRWLPSERLKLQFCAIFTCGRRGCQQRATEFVRGELAALRSAV